MKNIILKRMSFVNFKGLRQLDIVFDSRQTCICGDNGIGKTSIFDGFTWLLFGKDHLGRKQFGIRTYDTDGNIIPKIPHEVSAVIDVDGEEITLCRRFNEKWQKKRGTSVEEYRGNEEERLYNDVPCSVSEWNGKIQSICPENVFKAVTSPGYFFSQKWEVQREILFRMSGGISEMDVAASNTEFMALLANLTGKTIAEYSKEISAKKRRIKDELDYLPARIDERRRDMSQVEDWEAIEAEICEKQSALSDIERQLSSRVEAQRALDNGKMTILKELTAVREQIIQRTHIVTERVLNSFRKEDAEYNELQDKCKRLRREADLKRMDIAGFASKIKALQSNRERLISGWRELHAKAKAIQTELLVFDDKDFICPQCGRSYELEDVERIQQYRTERFEDERKRKLLDISNKIQSNEHSGKNIKAELEECTKDMHSAELVLSDILSRIEEIESSTMYINKPVQPSAVPDIEADEEINVLRDREKTLQQQYDAPVNTDDLSGLRDGKKLLMASIDELKNRLGKRDLLELNKKRIKELENMLKTQSDALARLEGVEYTISEFSKAYSRALEDKINALFSFVKFKLFDCQINGAEVETCEALVNGVPISDANKAGAVNAGLDIINAISKFEGIHAPIFLDNSESVNHHINTDSQIIKLTVSKDTNIKISSN